MKETSLEHKLYQLKNAVIRHTGPLGEEAERMIASRWIRRIERQVDEAKEDRELAARQPVTPEAFRRLCAERDCPAIGIAVHSLAIGGGEIFPIHLANELWEQGAPVLLMDCGMGEEDPRVRGMIRRDLPVLRLTGYDQLAQAANAYGVQIIHSHHAMIDLAAARAIRTGKLRAKQVITLHGMYEALDEPRAKMTAARCAQVCSCFAYIADKNLEPFRGLPLLPDERFIKLPNGLPSGRGTPIDRHALGIPADAFVLCLVSRARMEKGWKEAIEAVRRANDRFSRRRIDLILVGEGEAYDKLKNTGDEHIHFVGAHQDTRKFLSASDMGFLPSKYAGESFPLSIIDSLMCAKPVMATALGEIPHMLSTAAGPAGYLFPLNERGEIPVDRVAKAMARIAREPGIYRKMCQSAREAALRYDIRRVARSYLEVYRKVGCRDKAEKTSALSVKILISCHKRAEALHTDIFLPIQVGCALSKDRFPGMLRDDTGENISPLNRSYCEVTAQYWAWKNLEADVYGFFHYRRYLSFADRRYREDRYGNVYEPFWTDHLAERYGWTDEHVRRMMAQTDIATVKGREVSEEEGAPSTVRQQYEQAEYLRGEDLDLILAIIGDICPEYSDFAERYLNGHTAYYCSMFVCRRDIFFAYCSWLFPILEEFVRRRDMSGYTPQQMRTPGHLAERLWGIYYSRLKESGKYRIRELQCVVIAQTDRREGLAGSWLTGAVKKAVHGIARR